MGKIRKHSPHKIWSEKEIDALVQFYATASHAELFEILPNRSISMIQGKANSLGLVRLKKPAKTPDQIREAKRLGMAKRRLNDPDAVKNYQMQTYRLNRESRLASMKRYQRRRFFWLRATKLKSNVRAKDLASLWKKQRGLCALSGRRLNRENAQIDHIVARARGGNDEIENLRWLHAEVNLALRELNDHEFLRLCEDVINWCSKKNAKMPCNKSSLN
jgi:hypothetical protein